VTTGTEDKHFGAKRLMW